MNYWSFLAISALLLPSPAIAQIGDGPPATVQLPGQTGPLPGLRLAWPDSLNPADLGKRDLRVLAVQVMLDRSRHSPGVVDGFIGGNTRRAIAAFRRTRGLPPGDGIDEQLIDALRAASGGRVFETYTITQDDVDGPFYHVPSGFVAQSRLERLGYRSSRELLAERFHMDEDFLVALNPGVDFGTAGTTINVVVQGDEAIDGKVARIEVRKAESAVYALSGDGEVLASFPATIGSAEFPSPDGSMTVDGVALEATYHFHPAGRDWGPDREVTIAAGPNNPVGGLWIDLSREGYGIHGTPNPRLIGKTSSHGCVRLTNWDARALAKAVEPGTAVVFE